MGPADEGIEHLIVGSAADAARRPRSWPCTTRSARRIEAIALAHGEMVAELRQQAISALQNVRQINPERWQAWLLETEIYEQEANIAIIEYRDPGSYIDKVLALTSEARAHGADADQVDVLVCLAGWARAVYQGDHGIDPRAAFEQAITGCERAAAAKPDVYKYAPLGTVYLARASYEAAHGDDPTHDFERSERNFRIAASFEDNANLHYSLGRLWTRVAQYETDHGRSPQRALESALAELDRLTRSVVDLATLVEHYFKGGKRALHSVSERVDTSSAMGRGVLNIFASLGQLERDQVGERTSQAMQHLKSQGKYTGGRARFGFAVGADGVLVEDPAEQEILATARAARARGLSLRDIVAELEERGVRSRAGKPFALAQVARMLAA